MERKSLIACRESVERIRALTRTEHPERFDDVAHEVFDLATAVLGSIDRVEQNLDAIIVRCEQGDPKVDWLPTINRLAVEALRG